MRRTDREPEIGFYQRQLGRNLFRFGLFRLKLLSNPPPIAPQAVANRSVEQVVEVVRERDKPARLLSLLRAAPQADAALPKTLIFVNTKKVCADLAGRIRGAGPACGRTLGGSMPSEVDANDASGCCMRWACLKVRKRVFV